MLDDITKTEMMSLVITNTREEMHLGVETIQDIIETMDSFDKEFIIDMLQVVIAKHHHLPEDMQDIRERYHVKEK
jgi:hypothetical protein